MTPLTNRSSRGALDDAASPPGVVHPSPFSIPKTPAEIYVIRGCREREEDECRARPEGVRHFMLPTDTIRARRWASAILNDDLGDAHRRYAQATLTLNKQHRLDDAQATQTNTTTKANDEARRRYSRAPRGLRLVRRHGRRE